MSEICEITWQQTDPGGIFSGPKARFYARAIGSGGKFIAAESEEFRLAADGTIDQDDLKTSAAHGSIVHKLIQDGWQPVEGTSAIGLDCKFKRTIAPAQGAHLEIYFFWAIWAQPCKDAIAILDRLPPLFPGLLTIRRFDTDIDAGTAERFKIRGVPEFVFLKSGKECERILGLPRPGQIEEVVRRLLRSG
jgi:thioredoxin 1